MTPRSSVRTNIVIFTILGLVIALLIHFIVLSSVRYNWLDSLTPAGTQGGLMIVHYLASFF